MARRRYKSQPKSRRKTRNPPSVAKAAPLILPLSFSGTKSTTTHHASGFWDLLQAKGITPSLNKRTLEEFNRRKDAESQRQNPLQDRPSKGLTVQVASAKLKRFARLGGPDLSDIKGYPEPEHVRMANNQVRSFDVQQGTHPNTTRGSDRVTKSTSRTTKSGRSSAYKTDFMNLLITDGIDRIRRTDKPANYNNLRSRLNEPRGSLSPTKFSEGQFEKFLDKVDNAREEDQVMTDVFSVIKGTKSGTSRTNHSCKNWAPLTSSDLVIPKPDFFDGAEQRAANTNLREPLNSVIVPSNSSDCPFLPNFFAEVKAPTAGPEIARRQAIYDGAYGARAMHQLRAYGASENFDENAYTLSATYTDRMLEIFAHHLAAPDSTGQPPNYRTVSLGIWVLYEFEGFRKGVTAFRNARDTAEMIRETCIADANKRMRSFSQEDQVKYTTEAIQRTQEIVKRNGTFASSVATSRSNPPTEKDYESGADASDTTAKPPRRAKKAARKKQTRPGRPRR